MAEYKLSLTAQEVENRLQKINNLTASDVGADSKGTASSTVNTHNTNVSAHADIRESITKLESDLKTYIDNTLLNGEW